MDVHQSRFSEGVANVVDSQFRSVVDKELLVSLRFLTEPSHLFHPAYARRSPAAEQGNDTNHHGVSPLVGHLVARPASNTLSACESSSLHIDAGECNLKP